MPRRRPNLSVKPKIPVRREVSAGGLVYRRNADGALEFVLIRPKGSESWALPKGHLEEGESSEAAAVREVREETALEVGRVEPLGEVSYIFSWRDVPEAPLVRIFKRVYFFMMELAGGKASPQDAEVAEIAWVPAEQAAQRATYKDERKLIEKALSLLSETS
jgi:8-oxo-dGTP diphosphatase